MGALLKEYLVFDRFSVSCEIVFSLNWHSIYGTRYTVNKGIKKN